MTILLQRIVEALPAGFPALEVDAKADGLRHMTRLAAEFTSNRAMFHAIVACHLDGGLVGIGAITDEPAPASRPMWRMRRLYVHRNFRRRKIAHAIANELLQDAVGKVSRLTVHAGNDGAAQFWEAIGFRAVEGQPWSHETDVATILEAVPGS